MICSKCNDDISSCDFCGVDFDVDDDIFCMDDGDEHVCEACLDNWLQDQHSWNEATVNEDE